MAVARVTLVCPVCGKEFDLERKCMNRREADSWEKYMQDAERECPECYRARIAAETAEKGEKVSAKFELPEITGVSEKQIKYANDLRNKYMAKYVSEQEYVNLGIIKDAMASGKWDRGMTKKAEKSGKSAEYEQYVFLNDCKLDVVVVLMHITDAHTIIDFLKYVGCNTGTESVIKMVTEAVEALKTAIAEATEEATVEDDSNAETTETATETKKATYDKGAIMKSAWAKYKADGNKKTFGECLKAAWADAKIAAGVDPTTTKRTAAKKHTETATAKTTRRTNKTASVHGAC